MICGFRSEEPGHVDASRALVSRSGEEALRGEQEEDGGEAEGVRLRGANEGAQRGGETPGEHLGSLHLIDRP